MSEKVENHLINLKGLIAGTIKPSRIVGAGYVNPKSVASAWLRKEIHNIENPNSMVDYVGVMSNGKAYQSEVKAMKSKAYQALLGGVFKTTNKSFVTDYGVMPSRLGDGYEVYACLK
jgi:hypothetical protein